MNNIPILPKPPNYKDPSLPVTMPHKSPPHRKRRKCCQICCWCIMFIVMVILVVIFVGSIIFLLFLPQLPIFHLKSAQFKKLDVSNWGKGHILDSQTQVKIQVVNPNSKLKIRYGKTKVSMTSIEGTSLGEAIVSEFVQETNNVTLLNMTFSSKVVLTDKQAMEIKEAEIDKDFNIMVDIRSGIGTEYGSWTSATPRVDVHCGGINLMEVEDGSTPKCNAKVLQWFDA